MRRPAASLPPFVVLAGLAFLAAPGRAGVTPGGDAIEPGTDTIATLVERLGDADYNVRENAAAELQAIGPAAVDALLSAAETAADLEVSMRARWIVEAIPLEMVHDTPEAARLLEAYNGQGFEQRVKVMHRLLRLDDDSGIEALARIVRLERSPEGSRLAAALLAREWHPGDRWWPVIAERTLKGLGRTHRPAGAFLRALAEFSMATDPEIRRRSIAAAREAFDALERAAPGRTPASEDDEEDELFVRRSDASAAEATTTLARCLVRMLIADGRREEALDLTARLATAGDASRAVARTVDWLAWATDAGIPELVDRLDGTGPDARPADPLVTWAAAAAWRARGDAARAGALADAAFARHKAAIPRRRARRRLPARGHGVLHQLSRPGRPGRFLGGAASRSHAVVHRPGRPPLRLHAGRLAPRAPPSRSAPRRHAPFFLGRAGAAGPRHAAAGAGARCRTRRHRRGLARARRPAAAGDRSLLAAGARKRARRIARPGERGGVAEGRGRRVPRPSRGERSLGAHAAPG